VIDKKDILTILSFFLIVFISLDLETTGLSPLVDKIIEVAACKINGHGEIFIFNELVNPEIPIPEITIKIHGIRDTDVTGKPTIEQTLPKFLEFIENLPIVAHNAKFDLGFIIYQANKMRLDQIKQKDQSEVYCSCSLSRHVLKNKVTNHKLGTLAKELNIKLDNHHRAFDDAAAGMSIFAKELEQLLPISEKSTKTLNNAKLFRISDFDVGKDLNLPPNLKLLEESVGNQEPVEIFYTGGNHKNSFRPVKPISLLPLPGGNILYALCLLTNTHKSFAISKIKEVRKRSSA